MFGKRFKKKNKLREGTPLRKKKYGLMSKSKVPGYELLAPMENK
jgi:hypothetical protein